MIQALGQSSKQVRKTTSVRTTCPEEQCTFPFTVFCSAMPDSEERWYVAKPRKNSKTFKFEHTKTTIFLSVMYIFLNLLLQYLQAFLEDISMQITSGVSPTAKVSTMRQRHGITICLQQVYSTIKHGIVEDLVRSVGEQLSYCILLQHISYKTLFLLCLNS